VDASSTELVTNLILLHADGVDVQASTFDDKRVFKRFFTKFIFLALKIHGFSVLGILSFPFAVKRRRGNHIG